MQKTKKSLIAAALLALTAPVFFASPATALAPAPAPIAEEQRLLLAPSADVYLTCDGPDGNWRYQGGGALLPGNAQITSSFDLQITRADGSIDFQPGINEITQVSSPGGYISTGSFFTTEGGASYRSIIVSFNLYNASGALIASAVEGCSSSVFP